MAKMLPEIVEMLKGRRTCYVATADKQGIPNIGPKGSVEVIDEETLAFAELTGKKTYANIKENPNIAVAVVNEKELKGYRLVGKAELLTEGPVFEKITENMKRAGLPAPKAVVQVKVEEAYDVSAKGAGKKLV